MSKHIKNCLKCRVLAAKDDLIREAGIEGRLFYLHQILDMLEKPAFKKWFESAFAEYNKTKKPETSKIMIENLDDMID